jgi:hypothetical protein
MTPTRSRTRPAKAPAYIDKALLGPSVTQRLLAYLYMRQAPVQSRTLAIVGGIAPADLAAYLTYSVEHGFVTKPRRGVYRIGKVPVQKAAALFAAVRPCAGVAGGAR